MRVVAGSLRGRRLLAPPGTATRPTTDKVREAVFNALVSRGLVAEANVADLYAGSGALGIEALSRGARRCTFIERDRDALRALRSNLDGLGLVDRAEVVTGDALRAGRHLEGVELLFADPPYDESPWSELLALAHAAGVAVVVAESERQLEEAAGWEVSRAKRYGRTWITILDRVP